MKKITPIAILLFPLSVGMTQNISNYYTKYDLLPAPPSTYQDGLIGFANPASLGMMHAPEVRFYWTTDGPKTLSFNNWAILFGGRPFGFGMLQQNYMDKRVTDYSISFGTGTDAFAMGVAYDWPSGDGEFFNRQRLLKASAILRSSRLSLGLTSFWGLGDHGQEGVAELGLRPFGSPTLTLFGDALFGSDIQFGEKYWSAGAACRLIPGVTFVGRYFGTQDFTVGLVLDVGQASLAAQSHYGENSGHDYNSYMLRSGGFKNNIFQRAAKNIGYVPFELKGVVDHQKYVLFDDNTHRLYDLLRDIRAAANDPRISIIAINQTSMLIRPEHAWEVRQELKAAQAKGKRIIAYIETAGMTGYHLASVADMIIMEPQGILTLPGLVMGRTYLKGTLEKLGLGFDEWRFFTHKTAYETFSRDDLSKADREQYNAYLDVWYQVLKEDISASRRFSDHEFESILNESILFNGATALEIGLVDKLDRWSNIEDIIKEMNHNSAIKLRRQGLWDNAVLAEKWGAKPQIALVYGLGDCAMENGIHARYLERLFGKLADDGSVKAVVFRVDSPGGSGMASDLAAEALKKCAGKKPVIVSQGQVAGSGGYWISMYGDKILAGPNTLTGSIGVIGGWIWDEGLSAKLGMSADHVQRGEHADAMFGVTVPFLGLSIPGRNLTDDERSKIEKWIRGHYDDFITKVAEGRDMTKEKVDKIAQGRFYAGADGLKIGLIDEIGGLMMAIDFAKEDAGIAEDDEIELREYPRSLGWLSPFPLQMAADQLDEDPAIRYIKMIAENPYEPLPMMTPGSYPTFEK